MVDSVTSDSQNVLRGIKWSVKFVFDTDRLISLNLSSKLLRCSTLRILLQCHTNQIVNVTEVRAVWWPLVRLVEHWGRQECHTVNTVSDGNKKYLRILTERWRKSQRAAIAKVRYRKSPRDTCRTAKLTLTLVLTLTNTGDAVLIQMLGYRSLYKMLHGNSGICDSGLSPVKDQRCNWVCWFDMFCVLLESKQTELWVESRTLINWNMTVIKRFIRYVGEVEAKCHW